jgi:hypothetical protein
LKWHRLMTCRNEKGQQKTSIGITSVTRYVAYFYEYTTPPGTFGNYNSFRGGNSITLRSFNHSTIGISVMVQEDQCSKQSVVHIQGEYAALFIIGPSVCTMNPTDPYGSTSNYTHIYNDECHLCAGPCKDTTDEPTVMPTLISSSIPTLEPTPISTKIVTIEPTTFPVTERPTDMPSMEPSKAPTLQPVCIDVVMWDQFGDGWDTAYLFLFDSNGTYTRYTVVCDEVKVASYCFDPISSKNGDWVKIISHGYKPDWNREVGSTPVVIKLFTTVIKFADYLSSNDYEYRCVLHWIL